tara:strand:+ start:1153 stop:2970 length:1818 start_codon:yes stop_codon:yes gene_type:complete
LLNQRYAGSVYEEAGLLSVHDIEAADSHRNTHLLCEWLRNCIKEHPQCRRSFSGAAHPVDELLNEVHQLPSRVIDVGVNNETVKLSLSAGKSGMYTTLSHRWGSQPKFQTNRDNLKQLLVSINVEELPPTFRDAIDTTRRLGIQYLWIDSLCIVQGCKDDWAREAGQMGAIFENSTCTLAAIDAIDNERGIDRGLFLPRENLLEVHMNCAHKKLGVEDPSTGEILGWYYGFIQDPESNLQEKTENEALHQIVARPRLIGYQWYLMKSEWQNRGWILQERMLSRRIIHYTKHKIAWDCHSYSDEEELLGHRIKPQRSACIDESWFPWRRLVEEYTKCKLTFASDKLIAISGLANRLEARTGKRCFAGIFEDIDSSMGQCLLWRAHSNGPLTKYPCFHAPSWSWAAYEGAVTFSPESGGSPAFRSLISDLKFDIQDNCNVLSCPNQKATCKSGSVSFKGPVGTAFRSSCLGSLESRGNEDLIPVLGSDVHWESIPIPRVIEGEIKYPKRQLSLPDRTEILRDESGSIVGWVLLDTDGTKISDNKITCAAVSLGGQVKGFDYRSEENVDILVLQAGKEGPGSYLRIGRGRVVRKGWLRTCSEENVLVF